MAHYPHGDRRGNSKSRTVRRAWLLATFGDGVTAPCYRCGVSLDATTLTVDRVVPGCEGGSYRRDNIRPACKPCQDQTGGHLGVARKNGEEPR